MRMLAAVILHAALSTAAPAPELVLQTGHSLPVVTVSLSRDGALLATGSRDGTAILWDAATGDKLREIAAEPLGVSALALSPDGRSLLTGGAGTAKLWDAQTGALVRKFGTPGEFLVTAAFTPDGRSIATAGDDASVKFWDARTAKRLRVYGPATGRVNAVALSADGKRLAYAAGGADIWVWDLDKGTLLQQLVGEEPATALSFSPDARRLAAGGRNSVRVWDVARGIDVVSFKGSAGKALAFTSDGKQLLSCGWNNTARLWNAASGLPVRSLIGHLDAVDSLALSPGGRLAVTGSEDHTARLWDLASGRALKVFGGASLPVLYAAVSSDGRRLVTVDPQKASLWDLEAGKPVNRSTGEWESAGRFSVSRDARWLASIVNQDEVDLRDLTADKDPYAYRWTLLKARALALDPAGRFLVTAREDSLQSWDIPSASERALNGARAERPAWVGVGLEGRRLVTRGSDGAIELWDLDDGRRIQRFKLESNAPPDILISRDGRFMAAGAPAAGGRYSISIRALGDGEELQAWTADSAIEPFAFGPTGDSLLVLSKDGAWEWDLLTGRKKNAFSPPPEAVLEWPAAVDPAWRYLLARREDGVSVVSMPTGKELALLRLSEKGWIVTTPDGRLDAAPQAARWTVGLKSFPLRKFAGESLVPGLLGKILLGDAK